MVAQQKMPPQTREKTLEEAPAMDITNQQQGLNPTFLSSLVGPNMNGLSLGSLNSMPSAKFPLGYPTGYSVLPPSLHAQLLMRRSLMNPFSGIPHQHNHRQLNTYTLAHLAPGIQALQVPSQQYCVSKMKESGMPNANEIKKALATLAAAAGPTSVTSAHLRTGTSQASLPVVVFMECDEGSLSDYQCMLRKQIELFEA